MELTPLELLIDRAKVTLEGSAWSASGRFRSCFVTGAAPGDKEVRVTLEQTKDRYGSLLSRTQFKVDGKVTSRKSVEMLFNGRREYGPINEELRVAFEAQAPAIANAYASHLRSALKHQLERLGPSLRTKLFDPDSQFIYHSLMPICDCRQERTEPGKAPRSLYTLNERKLERVSTQFGQDVALEWFNKTNEKLGALENPVLAGNSGGNITITGIRHGRSIRLEQQRVFKRTQYGALYTQFPARLYVDNKFTPEKDYHLLFRQIEASAPAAHDDSTQSDEHLQQAAPTPC